MNNYNKNSTKLLPIIENYQNKTVFYTEYDGNFDIGDRLYIMVIDDTKEDYILDSLNSNGFSDKNRGYELLYKNENKIILDIDYEELTSTYNVNKLTEDICYIGRIYMKNANIERGIIKGALFYDVIMNPNSNFNIEWRQGIIYSSGRKIRNINFNKDPNTNLILKTTETNNIIEKYYVKSPSDLSIINLSKRPLELLNCNINNGILYNCDMTGKFNNINDGKLIDCLIGSDYIINGGEFINSRLYNLTVIWNNGIWDSTWTGSTNNPFTPLLWKNGTWKNGIFPNISTWENGRFLGGTFKGQRWNNGVFGYNDINRTTETTASFEDTIWEDGIFNGGTMKNSLWKKGEFNNGEILNTRWINGTFNNGIMRNDSGTTYKDWENGVFNNGEMEYVNWVNGEFNDGKFSNSIWNGGNFNNGEIYDSEWNNGMFYNGSFQNSVWKNGKFYNGSMFNSNWENGILYFGTMNNISWSGGTWLNGIANNIEFFDGNWYNGIFNYGYFHKGNWYDGSFNSGFFSGMTDYTDAVWHNGSFYFGIFDGKWIDGIFYTGEIKEDYEIPSSNIIGRPYKQYNIQKLTDYTYEDTRLPSKKRY